MISVTLVVKNGERCLAQVLRALERFDEVLLFDTGSSDATMQIAQQFPNVVVEKEEFDGFGKAHNQAALKAKNEWILSVDADEVVSKELVDEIFSLSLDAKRVYAIPFENYYRGKQVRWCGWQNERHVRLYNRKTTSFSEALVHEGVITDKCAVVLLNHPIAHYSYTSISDFLVKMERYSTLFAEQNLSKRRSSPFIAFFHGSAAFIKSYLFKCGFLGGYRGLLISMAIAHTTFYKYMKLYEAQCS